LHVQGVGAGWALGVDGATWWSGEANRWLGALPRPWQQA